MRASSRSHHQRFHEAIAFWIPNPTGGGVRALQAAKIAEQWLAEHPEDVESVQRLTLSGAMLAALRGEWDVAARFVDVGLDASMIGALEMTERLASTTLLTLLGAKAALARGDQTAARLNLSRAREPLKRLPAGGALTAYLEMHLHLIAGELNEASLEVEDSSTHFRRAAELSAAATSNRQVRAELAPVWTHLIHGDVPASQVPQAVQLLARDLETVLYDATLGLARTTSDQEASREALRICAQQGLPTQRSVLAFHGVIPRLPEAETHAAVEQCLKLASNLEQPQRDTWTVAIRAAEADAKLRQGRVADALEAVRHGYPGAAQASDPIAVSLLLVSHLRAQLASSDVSGVPRLVSALLLTYSAALEILASRIELLPYRAACEAGFIDAIADAANRLTRSDDSVRSELALLLDAMRFNDEPPLAGPSADGAFARAIQDADDRLGRLIHVLSAREKTLALILQHSAADTLLLCIDGDEAEPLVLTRGGAELRSRVEAISKVVEGAFQTPLRDIEIEAFGRAAFDALPAPVRERVARADTILLVPDFSAGQDRIPIELFHDGDSFLGLSKVIGRCLSLSHLLHTVEAPLVSEQGGRRALCVSVVHPPGLPRLAFADDEVTTVNALLRGSQWDARQLSETQATPEILLELSPLTNVLHMACHGEASSGAEAIVLADGVRLSSLNVTARHQLKGFTYLNACSLARGRYVGGGLSRGIAYAFARAGSRCVVANILPVEDQSAARIASAFYTFASGENAGEALRRARLEVASTVGPLFWSATVLVGDPFVRIGGESNSSSDATARFLRDKAVPSRSQVTAAKKRSQKNPGDLRFAASIGWAAAMLNGGHEDLETMAGLARRLGHPVGEATCLETLAGQLRENGDDEKLAPVLRKLIDVLARLRGVWKPAFDAQRRAQNELRALDPVYEPKTLPTFKFESGLTVNDRSDPAVAALLDMQQALDEHESYWRGDPALRVPDLDFDAAAWNMIVWGHRHSLYGTGAELDYAAACADRLVWRGIVPASAKDHLRRILAGFLPFLWGQQHHLHLEHWMAEAQSTVLRLVIERVNRYWVPVETSPAAASAREVAAALESEIAAPAVSKYARARAALAGSEPLAARIASLELAFEMSVAECAKGDGKAAGELGAWILGLIQERTAAAARDGQDRQDEVLALRGPSDALTPHAEGWFHPFLMEGFRNVRETGGQDLFDQWRSGIS